MRSYARFNERAELCLKRGAYATAFSYDVALSKLVGHYVEKLEVDATNPVDLTGALAAAATRAAQLVDVDATPIVPDDRFRED